MNGHKDAFYILQWHSLRLCTGIFAILLDKTTLLELRKVMVIKKAFDSRPQNALHCTEWRRMIFIIYCSFCNCGVDCGTKIIVLIYYILECVERDILRKSINNKYYIFEGMEKFYVFINIV